MRKETEKLPGGLLDTPDFTALFAGDLEAEAVPFTVQGHECTVWIRPMDSDAAERYATEGTKYKLVETGDERRMELTDIDVAARRLYLVRNSLTDWNLWQRQRLKDGTVGDWQQVNAPENERQRSQWIAQHFRCTPEFWSWLVNQCLRVNGLEDETAKN